MTFAAVDAGISISTPAQAGLDLRLGVPRERAAEVEIVSCRPAGKAHLGEIGVREVL